MLKDLRGKGQDRLVYRYTDGIDKFSRELSQYKRFRLVAVEEDNQ